MSEQGPSKFAICAQRAVASTAFTMSWRERSRLFSRGKLAAIAAVGNRLGNRDYGWGWTLSIFHGENRQGLLKWRALTPSSQRFMTACLELGAIAYSRLPNRGSIAVAFDNYSRASSAEDDTHFTASCYFGFTETSTGIWYLYLGCIQGSGRSMLSSPQSQSEEEIWPLEEAEEVGIDAKHFAREQTLT